MLAMGMDCSLQKASRGSRSLWFAAPAGVTMMGIMHWVARVVCACILGFCAAAGAVEAQDFGSGLSAYNAGEYGKAMQIWGPLARAGDARSQAGMGFLYLRGLGTDVDTDAAKEWYEKAALQGQPEAQLMLGSMYFFGNGV